MDDLKSFEVLKAKGDQGEPRCTRRFMTALIPGLRSSASMFAAFQESLLDESIGFYSAALSQAPDDLDILCNRSLATYKQGVHISSNSSLITHPILT